MSGKSGLAGVRDLFRLDCERLQGQASLDSEFTVSGRKLIELVSPFDRRSLDVSLNFMMDRECRGADTDGALELPVKTRLHDTKLRQYRGGRRIVESRVFPPNRRFGSSLSRKRGELRDTTHRGGLNSFHNWTQTEVKRKRRDWTKALVESSVRTLLRHWRNRPRETKARGSLHLARSFPLTSQACVYVSGFSALFSERLQSARNREWQTNEIKLLN